MPKIAPRYDTENKEAWKAINAAADAERKERNHEIDEGWRYYHGDHDKPLKVRSGQPDHNVILNLSGQAVDKMTAFLGVPQMQVIGAMDAVQNEPDDNGVLQRVISPEQELLDAFWRYNDLPIFIHDLLVDASVSGHTFVRLIPSYNGDGAVEAVEVAVLDGRYVQTFWNINNVRQVLFYRLAWKNGEDMRVQDIVPGALIGPENPPWVIIEYRVGTHGEYIELNRDAWPWPFAPIVDWKNSPNPHEFYGRSDIDDADLNDSINFVASNVNKIIFHHAGPQTVLTGGKLADDQITGPGTIIELPNAEARLFNLEMSSDLSTSMQFMDVLRGAFFAQRRVVDTSVIKDKLGALTNFAVRMLYSDMLDAAGVKQLLHGRGLAEVSRRALALLGVLVERVEAKWADPLPMDRGELTKAAEIESKLGTTSIQTLQEMLGRDPIQEAERRDEEKISAAEATANTLIALGQRGLM